MDTLLCYCTDDIWRVREHIYLYYTLYAAVPPSRARLIVIIIIVNQNQNNLYPNRLPVDFLLPAVTRAPRTRDTRVNKPYNSNGNIIIVHRYTSRTGTM